MDKTIWQLPHIKTQIVFVGLLLISTAILSYFTSRNCIKACAGDSLQPLGCLNNGDFYCCAGSSGQHPPHECIGCNLQNSHCVEFMIGAVGSFVFAILLFVSLLFRCRSLRKNKERSLWSMGGESM